MNRVILLGRLTRNPDMRATESGITVANFTLAVRRKFAKENEADFFNCIAWRQQAEFVEKHFKKGQQVAIEGRLQNRSYEGKDGFKKYVTEVIVEDLHFAGDRKEAQDDVDFSQVDVDSDDTLPF